MPFHQSSASRPVSPGAEGRRVALEDAVHVGAVAAGRLVVLGRHGVVGEPGEDVADAGLAGLEAEQAGHHPVLDDAAHPFD